MRIVFIGTPQFAVPSLRRLAAEGYEIAAVVTQPDRPAGRGRKVAPPPVKEAAVRLGLNVLQPETLRDPEAVSVLRALAPDVMIAVAYGQILRQEVLDIPPHGVLNVHPSLLPRHRGASPIAGAILAGDEETGVTIMLMDAGMDSGPVLAQERVPLRPGDTTGSLTESLAELGAELLVATLPRWLAGEIEPVAQDDSRATITRPVSKADAEIDWSEPAVTIWRKVRAYNPWPGAFTMAAGEILHIWNAAPIAGSPDGAAAGTVIPGDDGFAVQTGEGRLQVIEAQRAGRRRLPAAELLRGWPALAGMRLGGPPPEDR